MASPSTTSTNISDDERRWAVVGVCLTKVLTPALRNVLATELKNWYHRLCQAPVEIDKQVFSKYKKKLPPSKYMLKYENINNNNARKSTHVYDFAVKDPLPLAKLFVQPFMAAFTGFDQTMDISAVLTVMSEADSFISSGVAVDAKKVRSDIRNQWAHCDFTKWTVLKFNAAFQDMKSLVKKVKLSPADEKALCDDLDGWKDKGVVLIILFMV